MTRAGHRRGSSGAPGDHCSGRGAGHSDPGARQIRGAGVHRARRPGGGCRHALQRQAGDLSARPRCAVHGPGARQNGGDRLRGAARARPGGGVRRVPEAGHCAHCRAPGDPGSRHVRHRGGLHAASRQSCGLRALAVRCLLRAYARSLVWADAACRRRAVAGGCGVRCRAHRRTWREGIALGAWYRPWCCTLKKQE